jgi:hypothetical protein
MPTLFDIVSNKSCQSFLGHLRKYGFPFRIRHFLVLGEVFYIYKTLAAHGVGPNAPDPLEFRGQGRDVELALMGEGVGMDLHWDPPETPRPVRELQHRNEQQASMRSA